MRPIIIVVLLVLTGCTIRHTESEVAHIHGYQSTDRRPQFERFPSQRCYERSGVMRCFDLNWEAAEYYEVTP